MMTVKECYAKIGGNYEDVLRRLSDEARIERFLGKFLQDRSYPDLLLSIEQENVQEAFRAAHSLKGICLNLGLSALAQSSSQLTEALRGCAEFSDSAGELLRQVTADYEKTVRFIKALIEG